MIIRKVAVGDKAESYVENNLTEGINVISSDDNNKGKTIILQSMMYAIGNEPSFPVSFEYRNYDYYIEFKVSGRLFCLCRYNDSFVLRYETTLMIFDNVAELKRHWTKYIFELPVIIKSQISKIVDPILFVQLFFVGQDKKDISNIANTGYYNKSDFIEMLYACAGLSTVQLSQEDIDAIKSDIAKLKEERKVILQQHKILKSRNDSVSYLSTTSDRLAFGQKVSDMEKLQQKIAELRKSRNSSQTRKSKWETTVKELRSLNRTIECGELRCMECNSTNIMFSTGKKQSYTFDVSTIEMRNEIIESIEQKISS